MTLRGYPEYRRFWAASTVSDFGTFVTALALQVLLVVAMHASATEVGLASAARWLPYLLFGMVAGVLADRYRRRPILIGTDLGRSVVLGLIPLHAWFMINNLLGPVFITFVLRELAVSPLALGLAYAVGGVGGVLGSQLSSRAATRFGVGPVVIFDRFLSPVSFALVALAGVGDWMFVALGQFLFWFGVCLGGPVELGYRQSVTPDQLQGRMNATIRSFNWGLTSVGALAGGLLADTIGNRPTLWLGVAGLTVVAATLSATRFRHAGR